MHLHSSDLNNCNIFACRALRPLGKCLPSSLSQKSMVKWIVYGLRDQRLKEELAKLKVGAPEMWMVTWRDDMGKDCDCPNQTKSFLDKDTAKSEFELLKSQGFPVMLADGFNEHEQWGISDMNKMHAFVQHSGHALKKAYEAYAITSSKPQKVFSPQSRLELKRRIDACIIQQPHDKQFPAGKRRLLRLKAVTGLQSKAAHQRRASSSAAMTEDFAGVNGVSAAMSTATPIDTSADASTATLRNTHTLHNVGTGKIKTAKTTAVSLTPTPFNIPTTVPVIALANTLIPTSDNVWSILSNASIANTASDSAIAVNASALTTTTAAAVTMITSKDTGIVDVQEGMTSTPTDWISQGKDVMNERHSRMH